MKTKTIGEILREERIRHHISLESLAKRTRIRVEYLEFLETNNFDQLPAAAYVKGYIKRYAQLFGFDASSVLALLRRDYRESAKGKLVPREFLKPVLKSKKQFSPITAVALLVSVSFITLVGYIGYQWYRFQQPPLLEVTQPQQHDFVSAQVVVEGVTTSEAVVTINDAPIVLDNDGTFKTEVAMTTEGTSSITVVSTDRRGKKNVIERKVFVRF